MATDLGKVGIVAKGDYNSANTYEVLDAVTYNNSLYIAKQSVPAGTLPTNTTYWQNAISAANLLSKRQVSSGATAGSYTYPSATSEIWILVLFRRSAGDFASTDGIGVFSVLSGGTIKWIYKSGTMSDLTNVSYSDGEITITTGAYCTMLILH